MCHSLFNFQFSSFMLTWQHWGVCSFIWSQWLGVDIRQLVGCLVGILGGTIGEQRWGDRGSNIIVTLQRTLIVAP